MVEAQTQVEKNTTTPNKFDKTRFCSNILKALVLTSKVEPETNKLI